MAKDGRPTTFRFGFEEFFSNGDVAALTALEVGALLRLLRRAWQEVPPASIPDDDAKLARWAGDDVSWSDCKLRVRACFEPCDGGRLVSAWLLAKYEEAQRFRRDAIERAQRARTEREACAQRSRSDSGSESDGSVPRGTPEGKSARTPARDEPVFPAPLDTPRFRAVWSEYEAHRREKRAGVLRPLSVATKLTELAQHGEEAAVAAIRMSIGNGWTGIFPEKVNGQVSKPGGHPSGAGRPTPIDTHLARKQQQESQSHVRASDKELPG